MKRLLHLERSSRSVLQAMALMAILLSCFCSTEARLRVTATSSSNVALQRSLGGSSGGRLELYCDGYYTWITRDANGKTQVYVNDESNNFSKDEKYRVVIDTLGLDWRYFNIYGGKYGNDSICAKVNIKMDGGHVGRIILAGSGTNNRVSGAATFNAFGGTVHEIDASSNTSLASISGYRYVYLSNLKYLGKNPIAVDGNPNKVRIFVNIDCEFYNPSARLGGASEVSPQSYIVPDSSTWSVMCAYGTNGRIPTGHTVNCDEFYDYMEGDLYVTGNLNIRKCGGWYSQYDRVLSNFSNATIASHKPLQYIKSHPTCTASGFYISRCAECHEGFESEFPSGALKHDTIIDEAVAATCWRTGLTAGSHCGRCGEIFEAQEVVAKTAHNWGDEVVVSSSTTMGATCFQRGSRYRTCRTCYTIETTSGSQHHDFISYNETDAPAVVKRLSKIASKSATCVSEGLRLTQYCSKCSIPEFEVVEATGHALTEHPEVAPTCTEDGHLGYKTCSHCDKSFMPEDDEDLVYSTANILPENLNLSATGHIFGSRTHPVISSQTLIHAANCTEPALWKDVCMACGAISDVFQVTGDPALGHHYHIKQIDCINDFDARDGDLTLECDHCGELVKDLSFGMSETYGTRTIYGYDGYWTKSELVETTVLPTCIDGEGIYRMSINYKGQTMRDTYTNFIPACGYLHNYSDDGRCHEQHYRMHINQNTGNINKDVVGNISYLTNSFGQFGLDPTEYTTNGYIVTPYKVPCQKMYTQSLIAPILDPETGAQMYYTDYQVTQFNSYSDLTTAMAQQVVPFYVGTFDDAALNFESPIMTNPLLLGVDNHGRNFTYTLVDKQPYSAALSVHMASVGYERTFDNEHWQSLYVPVPLSVTYLEANGLQVARLNDTHMFDNDFDGHIDEVTLEFIRLTSGTLMPNRPYMIRATEAKTVSLTLNDIDMQPAEEVEVECSTVDQKISIIGTYQGLLDGEMYYNNYYAVNTTGGLQRAATTNGILRPQRWYLKIANKDGSPIPESEYMAANLRVLGADDEEVTGIADLVAEPDITSRSLYDLEGRRQSGNRALRQGIYVENGKRIIVK